MWAVYTCHFRPSIPPNPAGRENREKHSLPDGKGGLRTADIKTSASSVPRI